MGQIIYRHDYTYGTLYRLLFLWVEYLVLFLYMLLFILFITAGAPTFFIYFIGGWIVISVLLMLTERRFNESLPVKIEIDGNKISLWRFLKYQDIDINDVVDVKGDVISPFQPFFGGWICISYRDNGVIRKFYVAPFINNYFDLLRYLKQNTPINWECTRDSFSQTIGFIIFSYIFMAVALFFIYIATISSIYMLIFAVCMFIFGASQVYLALWRVKINRDSITLYRPFGGAKEVRWSEISSIVTGLPKIPSIGGFTLHLKDGNRIWIPGWFAHYFELMICILNAMDNACKSDFRNDTVGGDDWPVL